MPSSSDERSAWIHIFSVLSSQRWRWPAPRGSSLPPQAILKRKGDDPLSRLPSRSPPARRSSPSASSHGLNGEGGPGNDPIPAAPSVVDDVWDHGSSDGGIFDNIKNGVAPDFNTVKFKDQLKDPDICNVLNHVVPYPKKIKKGRDSHPVLDIGAHGSSTFAWPFRVGEYGAGAGPKRPNDVPQSQY